MGKRETKRSRNEGGGGWETEDRKTRKAQGSEMNQSKKNSGSSIPRYLYKYVI